MKIILSLLIIVLLSFVVISAPVCTVDEDGHYTCSFELPDTESVPSSYRTGTFEVLIKKKDDVAKIYIDTKDNEVLYKNRKTTLKSKDIESILDILYSFKEDERGEVKLVLTSSDNEDVDISITIKEEMKMIEKIEKILKKGEDDH